MILECSEQVPQRVAFLLREGLVARSVLSESRESVDSAWLGEGPHGLSLPEAPRKLGAKVAWPRVLVGGGDGMVFGRLKSRVVYCQCECP